MLQQTVEIFVLDSTVVTNNITTVEPVSFIDTPVEDYSAIIGQDIFGDSASSLKTNKSLLGDSKVLARRCRLRKANLRPKQHFQSLKRLRITRLISYLSIHQSVKP